MKQYTGTNWNSPQDSYSEAFLSQNTSQFWLPEEVPIAQDLNVWRTLPSTIKDAYVKNLITLTFFDSHQGNDGMLHLQNAFDPVTHDQVKSVLSFMNMMENIHAKSYSSIFTTYLTNPETLEYFKWGEANPYLQQLMNFIIENYKELGKANAIREYGLGKPITDLEFNKIKWKAMVSSVFLETWLFYSGFYLPLWFYGQGKLMNAGEIINLIIR